MQFLESHPEYKSMLKAESNYSDGHIYRHDGSPALFILKNKIDLGLDECRRELLDSYDRGEGRESKVYNSKNRFSGKINTDLRSSQTINMEKSCIHAAHNSLDIALASYVMPHIKCNAFAFSKFLNIDCCTAPIEVRFPFKIMTRQQLIYKKDDHFNIAPDKIAGHADDSIRTGDSWKRDKPHRTFSGLLYLTSHTEKVEDETKQFSGGELIFPTITEDGINPLTIKPKFGMIVVFPSSPMYTHTVVKVTAGTRITCLTWFNFAEYCEIK